MKLETVRNILCCGRTYACIPIKIHSTFCAYNTSHTVLHTVWGEREAADMHVQTGLAYMHTYIYSFVHAAHRPGADSGHIHTYTHACIHADRRPGAVWRDSGHIHTYIHTYIHTQMHTYMQTTGLGLCGETIGHHNLTHAAYMHVVVDKPIVTVGWVDGDESVPK
jgi:hypothetical protein